MTSTCILIGAGHAAAELAPSLRRDGWEGNIIVIGDEPYLPYHRPPLSKTFLAGEKNIADILIRSEAVYKNQDITLKLGKHVERIDRIEQTVILETGEELFYNKLALCTGSRVRRVSIPGVELNGIHYLRNVDDVELIKQSVSNNKKVVIVGGGYIGLETAAVLSKQGMKVTVLEMAPRVLERVTARELSEFYTRIHTEEGVDIQCSVSVNGFEGKDGHVSRVCCQDGRYFDADFVIIAVGILPNIELAEDAGLEIDNGIVVDEYAQTEDPNIVAAGDCTNHPNKLIGRRIRLESVPNAIEQARSASASICGKQKVYASIPWFWSDQYDLKLQISGLNQGYDQVIIRGDLKKSRSFVVYYLKDGKIISADCVNRPKEFMVVKRIMAMALEVDINLLADESVDPKTFLTA